MTAKTIRYDSEVSGVLASLSLRRAEAGESKHILVSAKLESRTVRTKMEVQVLNGEGEVVDKEPLLPDARGSSMNLPIFTFFHSSRTATVRLVGSGGGRGRGHLTVVYPVTTETLSALVGKPRPRQSRNADPPLSARNAQQIAPLSSSGEEACNVSPANPGIAALFTRRGRRSDRVSGVEPPLNPDFRVV